MAIPFLHKDFIILEKKKLFGFLNENFNGDQMTDSCCQSVVVAKISSIIPNSCLSIIKQKLKICGYVGIG